MQWMQCYQNKELEIQRINFDDNSTILTAKGVTPTKNPVSLHFPNSG